MYNHKEGYPHLAFTEITEVIKEYNNYKSARCCGLSGLLGLNGFFSSTASTEAIQYLADEKISETTRYAYASRYLKYHKENHLAQLLYPVLDKAFQHNELIWNTPSISNNELRMNV